MKDDDLMTIDLQTHSFSARLLSFVAVLCLTLYSTASFAGLDYFGRQEQPAHTQASPTPGPHSQPLRSINLPPMLQHLLATSLAWQARLNAMLRQKLEAARHQGSWGPALTIIGLSWLYGVLHAIGPGHGKVVLGSYFLTRRSRFLQGLAMSGWAALIQALSAIVLVAGISWLFNLSSRVVFTQAANLESFGYIAIALFGINMFYRTLRRKDCCGHAHHEHGTHVCDHSDASHEERDPHHEERRHTHGESAPSGPEFRWRDLFTTGSAVGLRPCSGALLVLFFTLANGIFGVGIVATLAMGAGVAMTVTLVSLLTVGLNRMLPAAGPGHWTERLRRGGALFGAVVIFLFGSLQVLGLWLGLLPPMLS